ncbi:MAG: GGDEF domain-containing protein [Actinomycetota bacterium]|nr:GGDEF domain-containing protein [Actinomycetota bacterium]
MPPPNSGLDQVGFTSTELARQVLDSLASSVAVIDSTGRLIATNLVWQQWAASPVDGLAGLVVGENFLDACRGAGTADRAVGDHIAEGTLRVIAGRAPRFEVQFETANVDNERWFLLVVSHLVGVGAVVVRTETTTHHTVQAVVSDLAFHDPLTGLPNRWLVLDRLRMAMDRSERNQSWTTVVFADLNGFKSINDTLGHAAGDEVLSAVARRLRRGLRAEDTCGRWGGDEFVMVLELEDPDVIGDIVRRLEAAFVEPVPTAERAVPVAISLGLAMARSDGPIERLLTLADGAMYRAKRSGRPVLVTALPDDVAVTAEL